MSTSPDRPVGLTSKAELDDLVATHDIVLVEFYTAGCAACGAMEPVLDGVARKRDVAVATLNPRDDPRLVEEYAVRSVPTLLLFVEGTLAASRAEGFLGVDEVLSFLDGTTGCERDDGAGRT